jgi:hypothetical protein
MSERRGERRREEYRRRILPDVSSDNVGDTLLTFVRAPSKISGKRLYAIS